MATERTTRNQRRLLVGLLVVATSLAAILGIVALSAGGEGKTTTATGARPAAAPTTTVRSAPSRATTTAAPDVVATATTEPRIDVDTSTVAADGGDPEGGDPEPTVGSTEACRADPACPSSEHRTSDLCGAALIVDTAGYLEGRHDAERGLRYSIDGAPATGPDDDDDDDATVGPQTAYRAGYVQGWCDGGGEQPAPH